MDGTPVNIVWYERSRGWIGKLEKTLGDLRHAGISPGRVSILFARRPADTAIRALEKLGVHKLAESDVPLLGSNQLQYFTWSPVSGFKGLENDVVVLVGIEDIETDWWRAITYVGMSRARTALTVLMDTDCEPVRHRRAEAEMKRRMEEQEMLA